ncbi:hypothetical protein QJQ45_014176 [Haematococcus lacustris]|nr:hypothetical protein QJQ45_014176 [Haematococcus lacustris]
MHPTLLTRRGSLQIRGATACVPSCRCNVRPACLRSSAGASSSTPEDERPTTSQRSPNILHMAGAAAVASGLFADAPALAESMANPFAGVQSNSLYVTMALFLMCVPGIWSQVKRAPVANKKRKTFEVDGPKRANAMPVRDRAKQIVTYFKKYNYEVKEMGEVITFAGLYKADRGQAAAVTFYTFVGMASIALVLSTIMPESGNWWYALTLLSPAAWFYYFQKGERVEEVRVKMVTADNEETTDITVEGDIEEITRFSKARAGPRGEGDGPCEGIVGSLAIGFSKYTTRRARLARVRQGLTEFQTLPVRSEMQLEMEFCHHQQLPGGPGNSPSQSLHRQRMLPRTAPALTGTCCSKATTLVEHAAKQAHEQVKAHTPCPGGTLAFTGHATQVDTTKRC